MFDLYSKSISVRRLNIPGNTNTKSHIHTIVQDK